jgi:hypothetical protein
MESLLWMGRAMNRTRASAGPIVLQPFERHLSEQLDAGNSKQFHISASPRQQRPCSALAEVDKCLKMNIISSEPGAGGNGV